MDTVTIIPASRVHVARQAARETFEADYLRVTGRPLPRADGDWWWPGTQPRPLLPASAPAPLSRQAEVLSREIGHAT